MAYTVSRSALLVDFDADVLRQINTDIRKADKELSNALRRELRAGANILRDGLRKEAREVLGPLPSTGRLNEGSAAAYSINNTVNRDRVAVKYKPRRGPRGFTQRRETNAGEIRHPVYGHRGAWVTTDLRSGRFSDVPGWWDRAEEKYIGDAGEEVIAALDRALRAFAMHGI